MSADFNGRITFNPDCKPSEPQYKIKCAALEISEEGSGDVREMMEDLQEKITDKVAAEFRTTPRSVEIVGYSIGVKFKVIGPVNRSLAEFSGVTSTVRLKDGTEIDLDRLTTTADNIIAYAKRTGKTPEQVIEMAKAELARQKKGQGAGAEAGP